MIKSLKKKLKRQERVKNFDFVNNNSIENFQKSILIDNPLIRVQYFDTAYKLIKAFLIRRVNTVQASIGEKVITKVLIKDSLKTTHHKIK